MVLGLGFKGFGGLRWFGFQIDFMWFVYIRSFFMPPRLCARTKLRIALRCERFGFRAWGLGFRVWVLRYGTIMIKMMMTIILIVLLLKLKVLMAIIIMSLELGVWALGLRSKGLQVWDSESWNQGLEFRKSRIRVQPRNPKPQTLIPKP